MAPRVILCLVVACFAIGIQAKSFSRSGDVGNSVSDLAPSGIDHRLVKRGMIEDFLSAGDGTACKLIIQFAFTMADYQLAQLVTYLQTSIAGTVGKRDVDHLIEKRSTAEVFTSIVNGSRGLSCQLIIKFVKTVAVYQFDKLVNYLALNMGTLVTG